MSGCLRQLVRRCAAAVLVCGALAPASASADRCNVSADQDGYIRQSDPTSVFGNDSTNRVRGTPGDQFITFARFDLSSIPPGSTIVGATAWFYVTDGDPEGPFDVRRITASWDESNVRWSTHLSAVSGTVTTTLDASSEGYHGADITALVQDWYDGTLPNHGIALRRPNGSKLFEVGAIEGTGSERPCITVLATPPGGSSVSGQVFEDPDTGAPLASGFGRNGVTVRAYLDDGDGTPDAGDGFAGSATTGGGGSFTIGSLTAGVYWVTADSRDLVPGGGAWYEQTRGADGSLCDDGSGGTTQRGSTGSCYGGRRRAVSDDASTLTGAEHVIEAFASFAGATGRDFGFSLEPVTSTRDGDDDLGSARTIQGSLRQFIANAAWAGFPLTTNFELGSGAPHRIATASPLPLLNDQNTVIDGSTQPGGGSAPRVEIDGSGSVPNGDGLFLDANNITVRDVAVTGFAGHGIVIDGNNATIEDCWVGVRPNGSALGNGGSGIFVDGRNNCSIGGTASGEPNRIGHNGLSGVGVINSASQISIRGNEIFDNGGLGIDLGNDGKTDNDGPFDGDSGPNDLQNFPEITSAVVFGSQTTLTGQFEGEEGVLHTIDVYSNVTGDLLPPHGEGETYHGSFDVSTNGSGIASLDVTVPFAVPAGRVLSATATWDGATSELSENITVSAPSGDLWVTIDDGVSDYVPGAQLVYTVVVTNDGPDRMPNATVQVPVVGFPQITSASWTCAGAGGGSCSAGPVAGDVNTSVDLPAGASATFTLTVDLDPGANGTLTTTATVAAGSGTADPDGSDNSAQDVDTAKPTADLSITKDDGVSSYSPGGSLSYTIVVANAGPSDAPGTEIEDLVTGLSQVDSASWSCAAGAGASCTVGPVVGDLVDTASIPAGGSVTYTLDVSISPTASGTLDNTASVSQASGIDDPGPGPNSDVDSDTEGSPVAVVRGRVLEDVDGDADASDAVPVAGVRVALFLDDGDGQPGGGDTPAGTDTTDPTGTFDLGTPAAGTYWLLVSSDDVAPSVGGSGRAEQTFAPTGGWCTDGDSPETTVERTEAGPCYGGRRGSVADNFTISANAEHLARIVIGSGSLPPLDFGFSFNVVTRAGAGQQQGSLRRFVQNANAIPGPNVMRFVPAVPPTSSGPGGDQWTIGLISLPDMLTDTGTTIDGAAWDLGSPSSRLDAATTVADQSTGPELVLDASNGGPALRLHGAQLVVRDLGIVDAGGPSGSDPIGIGLLVGAGSSDVTVERVTVVDSGNENIRIQGGATNVTVRDSVLIGAGRADPVGDGIGLDGSDGVLIEGNTILDGRAIGIDVRSGPNDNLTIRGNLVRGNGLSGFQLDGISITDDSGATIELNEIADNAGAGVIIYAGTGNRIRQNSIHGNGVLGIELTSIPVFYDGPTLNDDADGDGGPNGTLNFPVIESAEISGPNLRLRGFTRPTTTVEFFVADGHASQFGQGETFVLSAQEGTVLDTDATIGSYGTAAVNGVSQGEDTTTRFEFTVPTPPGVTAGAELTATATDSGGNTSEFSGVVTVTAPIPTADLAVTKDDGALLYTKGGVQSYTIVVTNNGPNDVVGAGVGDPVTSLPQVTGASWTCIPSVGASCTPGPVAGDLIDSVSLQAGASVTYTLDATISPSASGTLTNTVTVAVPGGMSDPVPGNDQAVDVDGEPGLAGVLYASRISASLSHPLYRIDPGDASAVQVTNLPFESAAIAMSPVDGRVYYVEFNTTDGRVGAWDPLGGGHALIGTLGPGVPQFPRLAFRGDGVLFGMDDSCVLYGIDTASGTAGPIGTVSGLPCVGGDIAFAPDGTLWAVASQSPQRIYEIDLATMTAAIRAPIAGDASISSLAIGPGGNLYTLRDRLLRFDLPGLSETDVGGWAFSMSDATSPYTGARTADLSVTKDDGATSYTPGGSASYTIVVSNAGPNDAVGATVTDAVTALPQVASASWSCTPGPGASCTAGPVAGDIGDTVTIPAGSSVTYTLDATIRPTATGTLTNTASVSLPFHTVDPTPANDSDSDVDTNGGATADLSITVDDGVTSYTPGGSLTYTIVVANAGPSDVVGATVSDAVTALPQIDSASWSCVAGAGASCTAGPVAGDLSDTVSIPAGSSVTYTLIAAVSPAASGNLTNTASVAAPGGATDPVSGNDSASDVDTSDGGSADLSITVDDGVTSYTPGGSLTYTIVVANAGPSDVVGASVIDTVTALPQVASASWTCSASIGAACTSGPVVGDIADTVSLPVGGTLTYTLDVVLRSTASGTLVNGASVAVPSGASDPVGSNDTASDSDTEGAPVADLSITKDDGVSTYVPGDSVTYTIVVTNDGPSDAVGATVSDAVTALPQVASASWSCSAAPGASCTTGPVAGDIADTVTVPAGGRVTYTLDVTTAAAATGNLVNTASVAAPAGTTDPDPADDTAADTDVAGLLADLSITKDSGTTTYVSGGSVRYTIVVANAGPSDVSGATVSDAVTALPQVDGASWSCSAGPGASCTAGPVAGDIADTVSIPAGGSVTYTLDAAIDPSATGTLVNTASVAPPPGVSDPDGANSSATDSDAPGAPRTDLSITKDDGVSTYIPGGSVTYTIVVANAGPSDATGATVTDAVSGLPQVAGASWTCSPGPGASCSAGPVAGDIADTVSIPAGGSVTYTLDTTTTAAASGNLVNSASVAPAAGAVDPDPANDVAIDTDSASVSADLSVTIDDGVTSYTPGGTVTYTVTVSNAGPSDVTGASVAVAPSGLPQIASVQWSCTPGAGASCSAGPVAGDLNDTLSLPSGASVSYTVDVVLDSGATGDVTVTASVTPPASAGDPDPSNDTAGDTNTAGPPQANLSATLDDGVSAYVPGGTLTYTLTIANAGPSDVTGASVVDTLSALPQIASSNWSCAAVGSASCTAGPVAGDIADTVDLAAGTSVVYTIDVTLDAAATGDLVHVATVTAPPGTTDLDPSDDAATDTDVEFVDPGPSINGIVIGLAKTADRAEMQPGQSVGYTVELRNLLATDVPDLTLEDSPPPGFTFVPGSLVVDGVAQPDPSGLRPMRIALGTLPGAGDLDGDGTLEPGEPGYRSVSYRLTPGSGAVPGAQLNRAVAVGPAGPLSDTARSSVQLAVDPVFDLAFIVGKVFHDRDGNRRQDAGEPGLPGALVALDDGTYALTDEFGRYHFPAVATGQRLIKLDEHSLPAGGSAAEPSRVLWLTPGLMTRADFAVDRSSETVEIGRPDRFGRTVAGSTEPVPVAVEGNAETLAAFINGQPVRLRGGDVRLDVASLDDTVDAGSEGLERPVLFHLDVEEPTRARHWALSVLDAGERVVHERSGDGTPPATVAWDGRTGDGAVIEPGGVYGYQLALEWDDGSFAVSPRRLFGVNRTSVVLLKLTGEAFESGSDRLSPPARTMLARAADRLRQHPRETIVIEGHTDSVGTTTSNLALSERRATSAMRYLVDSESLPQDRFVLRPLGESRPVASNVSDEGRALNRRVEIRGEFRNVDRAPVLRTHSQSASMRIDGTDVPLGESGEFSDRVDPGPDDSLRIEAVTSRGRAGGADVPIPALTIERPAGSFLVADDSRDGDCRAEAGSLACTVTGRTQPGNVVEIDGRPLEVDADGRFETELALDGGTRRHDLLVRNPQGYSRISNLAIDVVEHGADGRRVVVEPGVPPLTIRLPPAGARLLSTELPVVGRTEPGNEVEINGTTLEVATDGSFSGRVELPTGPSTVVVAVRDAQGRSGTIERPVEVAANRLFILAFADAKVGALSGDVLEATGEDDESVVDGRVALYLKGRIRGRYLITAAFDSKKGEAEYLFRDVDIDTQERLLRNLDPDRFYPVYGDGSSVVYDVESSGKLYLALDGDAIHALVGNFPIGLTDTELAAYQRTVYGARFRYLQPPAAEGERPPTEVVLFANEVEHQHVRDELLATGGSLYYLSQDDVVEGSEQVTVVVRDKVTGLTLRRDVQQQNADYTIKYAEGRLMFHRPVSSVVQGGSLVEREALAGHPVTIEIAYEVRLSSLDENGFGGRVTRQLGERVRVGGTFVNDRLQSGEYELGGVDAEIALGERSRLLVEAAESSGNDSVVYRSDDGGLSYTPVALAPDQEGSAFKVAADLDVGEWFDRPERFRVQAYIKELEAGFAANGTSSETGTRKTGLAADLQLAGSNSVRMRHDREERLGVLAPGSAQESETTSARWQRGEERWGVGVEYFDTERRDASGATLDESALVATRVWWRPFTKLSTRLDHQATLSGDDDDRTTLGVSFQALSWLALQIDASTGDDGEAAQAGAVLTRKGGEIYLRQRLTDGITSSGSSTIVGTRAPLGPKSKVFAEYQWDDTTGDGRALSLIGMQRQWDPSEGLRLLVSGETAEVDSTTDRGRRTAVNSTVAWTLPERLTLISRNGLRLDDRTTDRIQLLSFTQLDYTLNDDLTALVRYRVSSTEDRSADRDEADLEERSIALAYRPTEANRLNALFRYTLLDDQRPAAAGAERDRSWEVLALDASFRINDRFEWASKGALRTLSERLPTSGVSEGKSQLMIQRLNVEWSRPIDLGVEYRLLRNSTLDDSSDGLLLEGGWRLHRHFRFGLGYNFTDFSDNVFDDNEHSVQGWFLRLQGIY